MYRQCTCIQLIENFNGFVKWDESNKKTNELIWYCYPIPNNTYLEGNDGLHRNIKNTNKITVLAILITKELWMRKKTNKMTNVCSTMISKQFCTIMVECVRMLVFQ